MGTTKHSKRQGSKFLEAGTQNCGWSHGLRFGLLLALALAIVPVAGAASSTPSQTPALQGKSTTKLETPKKGTDQTKEGKEAKSEEERNCKNQPDNEKCEPHGHGHPHSSTEFITAVFGYDMPIFYACGGLGLLFAIFLLPDKVSKGVLSWNGDGVLWSTLLACVTAFIAVVTPLLALALFSCASLIAALLHSEISKIGVSAVGLILSSGLVMAISSFFDDFGWPSAFR
jgi:hypothetical protein